MGDGMVMAKSLLYNLKDMTLETVVHYFMFGQIVVLFLLLSYVVVYVGIVIFIKKGGVMYNKSIVFGDDTTNETSREKHKNKE
jgi:hypothetical protein